jgi:FtsH-binding integral membrane protein
MAANSILTGVTTIFAGTWTLAAETTQNFSSSEITLLVSFIAIGLFLVFYLDISNKTSGKPRSKKDLIYTGLWILICLCVHYVLAPLAPGHYPPSVWMGRMITIHSASLVGSALLSCWVFDFLGQSSPKIKYLKVFFPVLMIVFIAVGQHMQKDYAHSWEIQYRFWSSLKRDVTGSVPKGALIVAEPDDLSSNSQFIHSFSYATLVTFRSLFHAPGEAWHQSPWVVRSSLEEFINSLSISDGKVNSSIGSYAWAGDSTLDPCRVILLQQVEGKFIRLEPKKLSKLLICKNPGDVYLMQVSAWQNTGAGHYLGF